MADVHPNSVTQFRDHDMGAHCATEAKCITKS